MARRPTYKEMAAKLDEQIEGGLEPEDLEPAEIKPVKSPGASLTVRLSAEDFALIRQYTQAHGQSMSEFVRDALIRAIAEEEEDSLTGLIAGTQRLAKLARKVEAARQGTISG